MTDFESQSGKVNAEEPSVLEWFHSVLRFRPIPIPDMGTVIEAADDITAPSRLESGERENVIQHAAISWKAGLYPLAVILTLLAQAALLRIPQSSAVSVLLLAVSVFFLAWYFQKEELPEFPSSTVTTAGHQVSVNLPLFSMGLVLSILTYLLSGNNLFTFFSVLTWIGSILLTVLSIVPVRLQPQTWFQSIRAWLRDPAIDIHLRKEGLVLLLLLALGFFFRFYRLGSVPGEMWSDQAEKLLDVADVLDGKYSIFFIRNSGREAAQFYLSALISRLFGTGISFLTLKIGTALLGFLTLPFIYLFAREVSGRKAALFTLALAGMAFWPNLISRAGLRFPLYPFFAAPALYFLVRGIRRRRISDFIWSGIAVGFSLHGYSPARVLPLVILAGVLVFLIHSEAAGWRKQAFTFLITSGIVSLVVFMPLLRAAVEMPERFLFRTLSRMAEVERDIPGNPFSIFFTNLWDGLRMFNIDNGEIWILGPTHRPAFDLITAGFFLIGLSLVVLRYARRGRWTDLYLPLSIPLLLLPSILALAFPAENPAMNRASGAMIPALTIAGIGMASLADWSARYFKRGRSYQWIVPAALLLFAAVSNYGIVFNQYADQMERTLWNTADAGNVLRAFAESTGSYETGHVVAYPHWMDTRLVGIHAGLPRKDYAIWPDQIFSLIGETRPQLFIVNTADETGINTLQDLFPDGRISLFNSSVEGHDFLIYSVP